MTKSSMIEIEKINKNFYVGTNFIFNKKNVINIHALKDINLIINKGDRVGIIGRNGSGKSTLCKIISGITYPTSGIVKINGKVSSVLEAGTGFEPELSGYDNIFIGGAILGMGRRSIKNKINEIIDFSEVGELIKIPLKKYSSGMIIKLAFSVASFLDGDIMILDEILAVADEKFRLKCIKKILHECLTYKKTLLLVSHDIRNIKQTCNKIIYLKKGKVIDYGESNKVIQKYYDEINQ